MLTLYPFEPPLYRDKGIAAVCVGHPMADAIDADSSDEHAQREARQALRITAQTSVVALLPGSRRSEISLHGDVFLETAARFDRRHPGCTFVVPCITPTIREAMQRLIATHPLREQFVLHDGDARCALVACDLALVKSGTSTLEAMLLRRPMVVTYRLGWLTYHVLRRLLRTQYVALPNILAGRELVPELLQYAGTPQRLADALDMVSEASVSRALNAEFDAIHASLRKNADFEAAAAVWELLDNG